MNVQEIMRPAVVISEDASFKDAVEAMVKKKTNSLLVSDENGELVGEVEVSDLLDAVVPPDLNGDEIQEHFASAEKFEESVTEAKDMRVGDFMTMDFVPVRMNDTLLELTATAIAHQRSRIPVVDDENHPVGIISRRGLKHILAQKLGIPDSE